MSELRGTVARLRLYLEDDRTVNVLLRHVQERIVDDYTEWRSAVREKGAGVVGEREVGTEEAVRAVLKTVCEEGMEQAEEKDQGPVQGSSA